MFLKTSLSIETEAFTFSDFISMTELLSQSEGKVLGLIFLRLVGFEVLEVFKPFNERLKPVA
ncbi:hypothetical protein PGT21_019102 [Puccinia graminis f. sp. tritici]|uniref:Uncharacterized protein n=1 Tax=Puccinia graminis f. sp. tritici TaxID=56615 RepID=A0A5B0LQC7_PUCGR|nr:hypothetical protein PGT21_019102 [Puccinia graminis f. sp. tritici]KAA1130319.1 hypothetical protein PGTUg99_016110 [Puccinia graminis f. sp. tritici]